MRLLKNTMWKIAVFWNVRPCGLVVANRHTEALLFAPKSAHFYETTQRYNPKTEKTLTLKKHYAVS
jgi:hypothetical protein